MSGTELDGVPPQSESNDVSMTADQGEPVTSPYIHAPVTPYSVPVAGGYVYICAAGNVHSTYEAAEVCGRVETGRWCDYCERGDHDTAGCSVADHDEYDQRYTPDNGTVRCTCA